MIFFLVLLLIYPAVVEKTHNKSSPDFPNVLIIEEPEIILINLFIFEDRNHSLFASSHTLIKF